MTDKQNVKVNNKKKQPTVAIVLSGGGARGFAHIGALQVLEENGIEPTIIVGTSMGSVVGGMYAYGKNSLELEKLAKLFNSTIMMDINIFGILRKGIFAGNRIANFFKKLTNDCNIADCKKKFIPVAVDISTGKEYYFKGEEKLYMGIRASMGVPGVFKPLEYNKMLLTDGGVLNNLPCNVAKKTGADFIIAVDVMGDYVFDNNGKKILPALLNNAFSLMISKIDVPNRSKCDALVDVSKMKGMKTVYNYSFGKKDREKIIKAGRQAMQLQIDSIKSKLKEMGYE